MICSIRARLSGMSEFPLVGQGGLENLVDSLGDVRVRFGQLAKVQQNCPKITEIELGVLPPSDIHEPLVHMVECAFERRRKLNVFGRGMHQATLVRAAYPKLAAHSRTKIATAE